MNYRLSILSLVLDSVLGIERNIHWHISPSFTLSFTIISAPILYHKSEIQPLITTEQITAHSITRQKYYKKSKNC